MRVSPAAGKRRLRTVPLSLVTSATSARLSYEWLGRELRSRMAGSRGDGKRWTLGAYATSSPMRCSAPMDAREGQRAAAKGEGDLFRKDTFGIQFLVSVQVAS